MDRAKGPRLRMRQCRHAEETARLLAVARGDEPADLLLTGGSVFVPGTREWVTTDLAIADGTIAGWGPREARETVDVSGAALTAGLRGRPHAPRVHQALGRRVRPRRAPSRHDGGGRRPARDRQRLRRAGRRRPRRGRRRTSPSPSASGPELRPGLPLREPRRRARQRRSGGAARRARRHRHRRGHELPRRRQRRPGGARQDRHCRLQAGRRPRSRA